MPSNLKLARTVAILAFLSYVGVGQPAQGQSSDWLNLLQRITGVSTQSTDSIDTCRAELAAKISQGMSSGQFSADARAEIRAELERIGNLEAQFKADGSLSSTETDVIVRDLNRLSDRVDALMSNHSVGSSDIDVQQAELNRRIRQGESSGRLTVTEATTLRDELAKVATMESTFKADGFLSSSEHATLRTELNHVKAHIQLQMRDQEQATSAVDERQAEFQQKLSAGVRSGKITRDEALDLRQDFNQLVQVEAQLRVSGGFLSDSEASLLNRRLDTLMAHLDTALTDRDDISTEFDEKQAQLARRIESARMSGKITVFEYNRFKADLDHIADIEASFEASGGVETEFETEKLLADLDRLSSRLDRMIASRPGRRYGSGISMQKNRIMTKINSNMSSGRLTGQEARQLKHEFTRIERMESYFRASGGGLNASESARLSADLDRLSSKVDRQIADNQFGWRHDRDDRWDD